MRNKERIALLDFMIEWLIEQSKRQLPARGLCRAYFDVRKARYGFIVDPPTILETFPALKVITTMLCGRLWKVFWWNPDNFKVRIMALRLLRIWYRIKCYVFMIK